jgi:hypothetical protein
MRQLPFATVLLDRVQINGVTQIELYYGDPKHEKRDDPDGPRVPREEGTVSSPKRESKTDLGHNE